MHTIVGVVMVSVQVGFVFLTTSFYSYPFANEKNFTADIQSRWSQSSETHSFNTPCNSMNTRMIENSKCFGCARWRLTVIWNWCSCLWPQKYVWFAVVVVVVVDVFFLCRVHENFDRVFLGHIYLFYIRFVHKLDALHHIDSVLTHGVHRTPKSWFMQEKCWPFFLSTISTNSLHEFWKAKNGHLVITHRCIVPKAKKGTEFSATLCDERFINFHIIKQAGELLLSFYQIFNIRFGRLGFFHFLLVYRCILLHRVWRPHEIWNSNGMKFWRSLPFFSLSLFYSFEMPLTASIRF